MALDPEKEVPSDGTHFGVPAPPGTATVPLHPLKMTRAAKGMLCVSAFLIMVGTSVFPFGMSMESRILGRAAAEAQKESKHLKEAAPPTR